MYRNQAILIIMLFSVYKELNKMNRSIKYFNYKYWLDWVFPNRCPLCNKLISWDMLMCKGCQAELPFLDNLTVKDKCMNADCSLVAFSYKGAAIQGIYGLKHSKCVNFAEYASICLTDFMKENHICDKIDIVTYVPMSRTKLLNRNYNQAEVFAGYISKYLSKPLYGKLLGRKHNHLEQHQLTVEQRLNNAENVYFIRKNHSDVTNKNILICDDVITTGATMSKCIELLKFMGAGKIYVAAICTTVHNSRQK